MRKLIPIILAVIGLGAGIGAGLMLRPPPKEEAALEPCGPAEQPAEHAEETPPEETEPQFEYVKLNNQFIVPVVEGGGINSLVILSLSLEVKPGATEQVFRMEPKLRDSFLQVLFNHANSGGFRGAFTESENMSVLRRALLETAQKLMGNTVSDVLIPDIVRQDTP
ncbi:flagellar basal body-associated FliL family protein [Phaeovulum vinaykumarii]|uniref:Flagellar protein FliL n=1 Tax=Phaeovulum vinaykumarii TaxID=407234 RepID=A0A1N7KV17_9RHOB|nr:flagellar basal body-associated FliL family protein [Phaeovulum vinaykumarii]SIS65443.1 Flagellar basal body-associated protein FliL [Phaeovulum vinaykumarii]SOC01274.1 flagellar basal body-associated protein FliL [Phaeovulum vinaykumarii]